MTRMNRDGLIAEVLSRRDAIVATIVERGHREIPGYAAITPAELRPLSEKVVDGILVTVVADRTPTDVELRAFREFGAARGGQGVSLEDILRAWRMGVRVVLDELTAIGKSHKITDGVLLELTHHVLDVVDLAILEFSGGHRQVELDLARRDDQQRADFVRGLLLGTLGPAELGLRAQRFGLDTEALYVPFRIRPTAEAPAATTRFTTTIDGDVAGFAATVPVIGTLTGGRCAPTRLDHLPEAFTRATRALNTAAAFHLPGLHELGDLGLLPAVLADAEIGDNLVRRYLDPVPDNDQRPILLSTVDEYLRSAQRVELTAERLFVHANTVRYRLTRYQELAGVDLRHAETALELWWALRRAELTAT